MIWTNLSPLVSLYDARLAAPKRLGANEIALPQTPSEAFGDGSHPTTRLCAGAVDFLCRTQGVQSVLDVGTGTGVLARIALARGAKFITATDIDPLAVTAARANVALDAGSPIAVSSDPPDHWGPRFDLVVANILEGPLKELAPSFSRAIAPGGLLLLSGFTKLQVPGLRIAFENTGLIFLSESDLSEWVLLMFRRP